MFMNSLLFNIYIYIYIYIKLVINKSFIYNKSKFVNKRFMGLDVLGVKTDKNIQNFYIEGYKNIIDHK